MKIAIVTGASSGLGKEFVKQIEHLYKELDEIWVIARRRERLEELKSCMFTNVRILEGNLCEQNIYQELKSSLERKRAGYPYACECEQDLVKLGKVKKLSAEDQLDMIELNCKALTHMTKILYSIYDKRKQNCERCLGGSILPAAVFQCLCSYKILCA